MKIIDFWNSDFWKLLRPWSKWYQNNIGAKLPISICLHSVRTLSRFVPTMSTLICIVLWLKSWGMHFYIKNQSWNPSVHFPWLWELQTWLNDLSQDHSFGWMLKMRFKSWNHSNCGKARFGCLKLTIGIFLKASACYLARYFL